MDLYIEDENGTAFDVEMQTSSNTKAHPGKRTKYYQSLMDGDALKKGAFYRDLAAPYMQCYNLTIRKGGSSYAKSSRSG